MNFKRMCGRFTQTKSLDEVARRFTAKPASLYKIKPRYNIAPSQRIAVAAEGTVRPMRWGLVPHWAKDESIGQKLINARAETLAEKPSFRDAYQHRRCLIPADGFYEWQKRSGGKVPMYVHLKTGELFAFAGLWEQWSTPENELLESCTIITTQPNALMAPIHNRMPVILRPDAEATWLDPAATPDELRSMLVPYEPDDLEAYAVSDRVNRPGQDDASLIEACGEMGLFDGV